MSWLGPALQHQQGTDVGPLSANVGAATSEADVGNDGHCNSSGEACLMVI